MEKNVKKTELHLIFFAFFSFALLFRFIIGGGYFNEFDTYWYRGWAVDIAQNGLFDAYTRAGEISLDYPPVYLLFLYPVGLIYKVVGTDTYAVTQMLLMKFWPIVFDCAAAFLIYKILKKRDILYAFLGAVLWLINPSAVFNCAFWGQTDSVMVLLLVLSFYLLNKNQIALSAVIFAIAGLTKYQCLFFVPVYLLELYLTDKSFKNLLKGIVCAAVSVIAVFLPFMIGAKDLFLIFKVYFGGAGTYKYCTLNAFNIYGLFGLNWVNDSGFYGVFGIIMLVVFTVGFAIFYIKAKNRSIYGGALIYMFFIFIFVTRMHERYLFVILGFSLVLYLLYRTTDFLILYILLSVITLFNQMLVLFNANFGELPIFKYYDTLLKIGSAVCILIFIYALLTVANHFLSNRKEAYKNEQSL